LARGVVACGGAVGLAGALIGVPAVAQRAGAVELGAFGRYTIFDDTLRLDDAFGGGGRLGVFVARNFAIEAEGSYSEATVTGTSTRVWNVPGYLRLVYNLPLGARAALLLGAGGVYSAWESAYDDVGANGLLGLRIGLGGVVALRLDGLADYIPSPRIAGDENLNLAAQLGISFLLGATPPDGDADGVPDPRDACPATPAGERVDATGCPVDGDEDGVPDARDQCPGTPAGQAVDPSGCAPDSDRDGVRDPGGRPRGRDRVPTGRRRRRRHRRRGPVSRDAGGHAGGRGRMPEGWRRRRRERRGRPLPGHARGRDRERRRLSGRRRRRRRVRWARPVPRHGRRRAGGRRRLPGAVRARGSVPRARGRHLHHGPGRADPRGQGRARTGGGIVDR
jgi:hypothetical protein